MTPPVQEIDEKKIGDLVIRIDRLLCVGFGDCIDLGPDLFEFDEEGIAVFKANAPVDREMILAACESCPVDALTVLDPDGRQLVP